MANNARYVFRASRDAHKAITELFDFVQPTAISLWNLRWQVAGYLSSVPNADTRMLDARFAVGSGIGSGSLKRATIDTTWDEQLDKFSSFILINAIAVFEDYVSTICEVSSLSNSKKKDIFNKMQFPSHHHNGGIASAISTIGTSNVATGAFTWNSKTARRMDEPNVEKLLVCYRYFKELRNSISHNGGRVGQRQLDAQAEYAQEISNNKIGPVNAPVYLPVTATSDAAKISYRGIIGFSEVILSLIATYDLILSKTKVVEDELLAALPHKDLPWPLNRSGQVVRFTKIFGYGVFPEVSPTQNLIAFLKSKGHIPQNVL